MDAGYPRVLESREVGREPDKSGGRKSAVEQDVLPSLDALFLRIDHMLEQAHRHAEGNDFLHMGRTLVDIIDLSVHNRWLWDEGVPREAEELVEDDQ